MFLFLIKKIFCIFLVYSGICSILSFINRNSTKILLYHGIINEKLPSEINRDDLHIQLKYFERQIKYLKNKYHILDINEFVNYLKENKPLPKYSVILTFDDGYGNNYENLKYIILKYKIPVSIFLVTDYVGTSELLWLDRLEIAFSNTTQKRISSLQSMGIGLIEWNNDEEKMERYGVLKNYLKKMPHEKLQDALKNIFYELDTDKRDIRHNNNNTPYTRLLNWDEVKELAQYGVRFGSHTCRHEILTALSDREIKNTLKRSFLSINNYCRAEGISFAYPNGNFNEETKKAVAEAGYNCALTTIHGFNSTGCDLYALRRNEVGNKGDIHIFIANLSGAFDFIKSFAKAF